LLTLYDRRPNGIFLSVRAIARLGTKAQVEAIAPYCTLRPILDLANNRHMTKTTLALTLTATLATLAPAHAKDLLRSQGPADAPFVATLSNTTPLAFGMAAVEATRALGAPLTYVSGRPGNEIYLAIRTAGGSGFFDRRDRLYLQFRKGRLTGWKGDWGRNWMWQ
jgi:hypothetical protein